MKASNGTFTQKGGSHTVTGEQPGIDAGEPRLQRLLQSGRRQTGGSAGDCSYEWGVPANGRTTNSIGEMLNLNATPGGKHITMEGGTLTTANESFGNGTFTQKGGSHTVTGTEPGLMVGGPAPGYFNLEGGTLNAYKIGVGQGVFRQLPGTTNTIGNSLLISTTETGESTYSLEGGVLNSNNFTAAISAMGNFCSSGRVLITWATLCILANPPTG